MNTAIYTFTTTIHLAAHRPQVEATSVAMRNGNGNNFTVGHVIGKQFRPTNAPQSRHFAKAMAEYVADNGLTIVQKFA